MTRGDRPAEPLAWTDLEAPYQTSTVWLRAWQVVNTLGPYAVRT